MCFHIKSHLRAFRWSFRLICESSWSNPKIYMLKGPKYMLKGPLIAKQSHSIQIRRRLTFPERWKKELIFLCVVYFGRETRGDATVLTLAELLLVFSTDEMQWYYFYMLKGYMHFICRERSLCVCRKRMCACACLGEKFRRRRHHAIVFRICVCGCIQCALCTTRVENIFF